MTGQLLDFDEGNGDSMISEGSPVYDDRIEVACGHPAPCDCGIDVDPDKGKPYLSNDPAGCIHCYQRNNCPDCRTSHRKYWTETPGPAFDMVNSPPHYNRAGIEVIDVIDTYTEHPESYYHGNVIKYVLRAIYKGNRLEDWKKALWYLTRMITLREKNESDAVPAVPTVEGDQP